MMINEIILSRFKSTKEFFHKFDNRVGIFSDSCKIFKQINYQRLKVLFYYREYDL